MSASAAASTRAAFGGAFILVAQSAVLVGWTAVSTWATPICWWGYLLLLDALVEARTGRSPFVGRPARFVGWVSLSVLFWLLFEAYNLRLRNWEYVGLPADTAVRWSGYLVSFATILPGLFLTAAALGTFGLFDRARCRPLVPGRRGLVRCAVTGAACLVVPLLVPAWLGRYLFVLVWVGFILLLEPLNYRLGAPSVLADLARGRPGQALRLLASGYVCGVLWEFWNYWAVAKWIYHVPFLPEARIFEMPVLGFLGFGPFALEYYAMYNAVQALRRRAAGRGRRAATVIDPLIP